MYDLFILLVYQMFINIVPVRIKYTRGKAKLDYFPYKTTSKRIKDHSQLSIYIKTIKTCISLRKCSTNHLIRIVQLIIIFRFEYLYVEKRLICFSKEHFMA